MQASTAISNKKICLISTVKYCKSYCSCAFFSESNQYLRTLSASRHRQGGPISELFQQNESTFGRSAKAGAQPNYLLINCPHVQHHPWLPQLLTFVHISVPPITTDYHYFANACNGYRCPLRHLNSACLCAPPLWALSLSTLIVANRTRGLGCG